MPTIKVYDMAGNEIDTLELSEEIFGAEVKVPVLHAAVRTYLMNQRQGTQSTLTRTEVSGGGKKPWRQKGTGRARQGSTRSPQWTHGGVALGPKPRSYRKAMNDKTKRLAFISALSAKASEGNLIVVDDIVATEYKTKVVAEMLKAFGAPKKALIVTGKPDEDRKFIKSAANIPGVVTSFVYRYFDPKREVELLGSTVNVYDIINANKLIIAKSAVLELEEEMKK
ncbi:MAG: 50S ribosomal protein L4 [Clostridia bacterium]|nr:50S ribosomal protein L4 [Clostridia bacterium]